MSEQSQEATGRLVVAHEQWPPGIENDWLGEIPRGTANEAAMLMLKAHDSQLLWGGDPYYYHPVRVMHIGDLMLDPRKAVGPDAGFRQIIDLAQPLVARAVESGMTPDDQRAGNLLHDAIEKSNIPIDDASFGVFTANVMDDLALMTWPGSDGSEASLRAKAEYYDSLARNREHPSAQLKRLCDVLHNIDPRRHPPDKQPVFESNLPRYFNYIHVVLEENPQVPAALVALYPDLEPHVRKHFEIPDDVALLPEAE